MTDKQALQDWRNSLIGSFFGVTGGFVFGLLAFVLQQHQQDQSKREALGPALVRELDNIYCTLKASNNVVLVPLSSNVTGLVVGSGVFKEGIVSELVSLQNYIDASNVAVSYYVLDGLGKQNVDWANRIRDYQDYVVSKTNDISNSVCRTYNYKECSPPKCV